MSEEEEKALIQKVLENSITRKLPQPKTKEEAQAIVDNTQHLDMPMGYMRGVYSMLRHGPSDAKKICPPIVVSYKCGPSINQRFIEQHPMARLGLQGKDLDTSCLVTAGALRNLITPGKYSDWVSIELTSNHAYTQVTFGDDGLHSMMYEASTNKFYHSWIGRFTLQTLDPPAIHSKGESTLSTKTIAELAHQFDLEVDVREIYLDSPPPNVPVIPLYNTLAELERHC